MSARFNFRGMKYREFKSEHPIGSGVTMRGHWKSGPSYEVLGYNDEDYTVRVRRVVMGDAPVELHPFDTLE